MDVSSSIVIGDGTLTVGAWFGNSAMVMAESCFQLKLQAAPMVPSQT